MKKMIFNTVFCFIFSTAFVQEFEKPQLSGDEFEEVNANFGADFALQFQSLNHEADSALIPLGTNINLPTANLIMRAALGKGIELNLSTYLSSRHHPEAWVKGGYILFDELPFLDFEAVDNAMDYLTLKAGVMELNYGDAHFRRSDNGEVINNPFVGNYIMDAFTTAPSMEIMYRNSGIIAMAAVTTGSLRPDLAGYSSFSGTYTEYNIQDELAFYWKAGYDKQVSEDFRIRGTVSGYHCGNHHFGSLYYGDRAGSRYYLVMQNQTGSGEDVKPASGHTTGRWGPGFTDQLNSFMVNGFAQWKGLEIFATYETADGTSAFGGADLAYSQIAGEALYRFGKKDRLFGGLRYNTVMNDNDMSVDRIQASAGAFLTENIVMKLEYVDQTYNDFISQYGSNAGFNGLMIEAGVSF